MSTELKAPHNEDAEAAVLGAIMRWASQGGGAALADADAIIGDDGFHLPRHRAVWDALRSLAEQGGSLDRISVEAELRSRGTFGDAGGAQGVSRMIESASAKRADMLAHATLIAEMAQLRAAFLFARQLVTSIASGPFLTGPALHEQLTVANDALTDIVRSGGGGRLPWTAAEVDDQWRADFNAKLSGQVRSISTGFPQLDWYCGRRGPQPGWLVVLSGRPKSGKTSAALAWVLESNFERVGTWPIAWRPRQEQVPVLYCCDEMRAKELHARLLINLAGVDQSMFSSPEPAWYERNKERIDQASNMLRASDIHFIPDEFSSDMVKALGYARRWRARHEIIGRDPSGKPIRRPALCVWDFVQSFKPLPSKLAQRSDERLSAKVYLLKKAAKEFDVVNLALSQLNRSLEKREIDDRRPRVEDNEGSGAIEQYADVAIGTYRDAVYDPLRQHHKDRAKELRSVVVESARRQNRSVGSALRELDEMLFIRSDTSRDTRFLELTRRCDLSTAEFDELARSSGKLTAAELIVQVNRHGDTGTTYADFYGQYYRFLPRLSPA